MSKQSKTQTWTSAAAAIAVAGGIAAASQSGASAASDFTNGSLMSDLGGIAEHDSKRIAEAQFNGVTRDRFRVQPGVNPSVGPQALSIAVCSLNECSDVACAGPDSRIGDNPGHQALSIAVCSLNECTDVAC